jgi:hypothetical protein
MAVPNPELTKAEEVITNDSDVSADLAALEKLPRSEQRIGVLQVQEKITGKMNLLKTKIAEATDEAEKSRLQAELQQLEARNQELTNLRAEVLPKAPSLLPQETDSTTVKVAKVGWLALGTWWLWKWLKWWWEKVSSWFWWEKKNENTNTTANTTTTNSETGGETWKNSTNITVVNEDKGMSRLQKGLLRLGLGWAAVRGYKNWNYVKGKWNDYMGNNLPFEDSFRSLQADFSNISEMDIQAGMGIPELDNQEHPTELRSYGYSVKFNKDQKQIEGLDDIQFTNYQEMLRAAHIINYCKRRFHGRCANNQPFKISSPWWDIHVSHVNADGSFSDKEIISGGYFSTLSDLCPVLKDGIGRTKFVSYLNTKCEKDTYGKPVQRQRWDQQEIPNPDNDPVIGYFKETLWEVVSNQTAYWKMWNARNMMIEKDTAAWEGKYIFDARNSRFNISYTDGKYRIDSIPYTPNAKPFPVEFTDPKEFSRTCLLLSFMMHDEYMMKSKIDKPWKYYDWSIKNKLIATTLKHFKPWIWFNDRNEDTDRWDIFSHDYCILNESTFQWSYKTLYPQKEKMLEWLNGLLWPNKASYRRKQS